MQVLEFLRNRELNEMYVSMFLRSLAASMIGIFIPIYLLQVGLPFQHLFKFFIILEISQLSFIIPSFFLSYKFGIKHIILFSNPFFIVFYLMLLTLENFNWPLWLIACVGGIGNSLFWSGYHSDFSLFSDKKGRGKEISFVEIITKLVGVIGPIISGVILTIYGFPLLFVLVSIIFLLSAFPLFLSKETKSRISFSLREIFSRKKIGDYIGFMSYGIESGVNIVVWPTFIFLLIFKEFYDVGFVTSISFALSLGFTFLFGEFCDLRRSLSIKLGSLSNFLAWVIRSIVKTPLQVFLANSFYGISIASLRIPFNAITYDRADKRSVFIMFREIFIHVGRLLLYSTLFFFPNFYLTFPIAMISSLFVWMIAY